MDHSSVINPYESPQSSAAASGSSNLITFYYPYTTARPRAFAAIAFTLVYLACIVTVAAMIDYGTRRRTTVTHQGRTTIRTTGVRGFTQETVQTIMRVTNTAIAVSFVATIAFLMWVHRAYRNLPALGARNLNFTPGWAVAYFFIPLLNFYRPLLVMQEIYRASNAVRGEADLKSARNSIMIYLWWFTWMIAMMALGYALTLNLIGPVKAPNVVEQTGLKVANFSTIIASILGMLVVAIIQTRQTWNSQFIESPATTVTDLRKSEA